MSRLLTVLCDSCGKQKQETNHWFRIYTDSERIIIGHSYEPEPSPGQPEVQSYDLCGESCLVKKISELIKR